MILVWQTVRRITSEILGVKGLNRTSDLHQISPYNITPESHVKIMRIKEMITTKEAFDW